MKTAKINLYNTIINYVDEFYDKTHKTPTLRQMEADLGFSRQSALRYLRDMDDEGLLTYDAKNIVTPYIKEQFEASTVRIPVSGAVPCGAPESETEEILNYINIPKSFINKTGTYFALIAEGDSMKNAGIDDGDIVLVRKTGEAKNNQFVVALNENNGSTLKRLKYTPDGIPFLHPENEKYDDIFPAELKIQGVAEKVIKDLSRYE